MSIEFGARVRQRRQQLQLTSRELGERVGVSERTIHHIELGKHGTRYGVELARALSVSLEWLETGDLPMPAPLDTGNAITTDARAIGQRIRERRRELRMSQHDVAGRIGVSKVTIYKIEQGGKTRYFSKLAEVLEVPTAWLVTGDSALKNQRVGYWPFQRAQLTDFESLTPAKQIELDTRMAEFIAGAIPPNSPA